LFTLRRWGRLLYALELRGDGHEVRQVLLVLGLERDVLERDSQALTGMSLAEAFELGPALTAARFLLQAATDSTA
jgi:hypothetical protein